MILKELSHNQQRSMLSPNVALSTPFRAILPPIRLTFGFGRRLLATDYWPLVLRAAGASRFPAPKETGWPRSLS